MKIYKNFYWIFEKFLVILQKRSTDEDPWEGPDVLQCKLMNYEKYAQSVDAPTLHEGLVIEGVKEGETNVCVVRVPNKH